jgi:hypothetical protein
MTIKIEYITISSFTNSINTTSCRKMALRPCADEILPIYYVLCVANKLTRMLGRRLDIGRWTLDVEEEDAGICSEEARTHYLMLSHHIYADLQGY